MLLMGFGKRLAAARQRMQPPMSQAKLAKRIGRDQSTVAKWETKAHVPRGIEDIIPKLAAILNVPQEELMFGGHFPQDSQEAGKKRLTFVNDPKHGKGEEEENPVQDDLLTLIDEVSALPDRAVPSVLRLVRRIKATVEKEPLRLPPPDRGAS